ncbi:MAG: peptidoglycan-binding protein [Acutalibacteraceae bacterium]
MKSLGVTLVVDEAPTEQQTAALQAQGIQVLAISPAKSRDDCKRLYREVGSAMVGGNTGYTKGEKACDNVFYTLDDITRLVPSTGTQYTACYLYDLEGHAATGNSLFGSLISYAGFFNSFGNELNNEIDINTLQVANPYYIFCATGLKEQLEQSENFKNLDAVKNGRVYEMDPSLMQRQGNTMLDTVTTMLKHVYPELFVTKESKKDTSNSSSQSDVSPPQLILLPVKCRQRCLPRIPSSAQGTVSKPTRVANAGTLQYGSSGEAVTLMQERLKELGYMFTAVNGTFDDGTMQAVKDFQLLNGFSTSGIATQEVLDAMYNSNATPRT